MKKDSNIKRFVMYSTQLYVYINKGQQKEKFTEIYSYPQNIHKSKIYNHR
jgi:hypothetical protein